MISFRVAASRNMIVWLATSRWQKYRFETGMPISEAVSRSMWLKPCAMATMPRHLTIRPSMLGVDERDAEQAVSLGQQREEPLAVLDRHGDHLGPDLGQRLRARRRACRRCRREPAGRAQRSGPSV